MPVLSKKEKCFRNTYVNMFTLALESSTVIAALGQRILIQCSCHQISPPALLFDSTLSGVSVYVYASISRYAKTFYNVHCTMLITSARKSPSAYYNTKAIHKRALR